MLYTFYCRDHDGQEPLRKQTRDAHLSYLEAFKVVTAGPLLSSDGNTMIGSLLIVELEDQAAAEAFAQEDPYAKAGLFAQVEINPFRKVIG